MRPHLRVVPAIVFLSAMLFSAVPLFASLDRGQVQGTVTDPQGAIVPGAKVVVRNVDTGVETKLVTNGAGFFLATDLVPGKYTVRVEAPGFRLFEISNVVVTANTTVTEDSQLTVGTTAQTIEVRAQAQLAQTTASNFSSGVSQRYVEDLPLQGRDIQTLVQLFPGVVQSSGPSGAVFGTNSAYGGFPDPLHIVGSSVSSNGGQAGANAWFLEGALNATVGAESATVNPSPDAVAEFNLVQNSLAAEYGRTSGMVVNVVLKSGTNNLHGSAYGVNRNSVFSATNPFSRRDQSGTPSVQPWSNWNDFGATLGGPVYIPHIYNGKNRTFFFVSEEMSFLHVRENKILTVPLAAEKNGDFTGDPRFGTIYDPFSTKPNPNYQPDDTLPNFDPVPYVRDPIGSVIPSDKIDSLAKFYLDSIPAPNYVDPLSISTCGIYCNNYVGAVGSSMTTHNASVKVDHNINEKNRLFVSWLYNPSYYSNYRYPWNGPTAQTGTGIAGANPYRTRNQLAIVGLTSTINPTLVNELRVSFGRQNLRALPNLDSVTDFSEIQQKVAGLNFWLFSPGQEVPTIAFQDNPFVSYMQFGTVQYQDNSMGQQAFTVSDNLTKIWGRHTIKGGFSFRRNNLWGTSPAGYNINFDGYLSMSTQDQYYGTANPNGLADFLLGAVPQGGGSSAVQYSPWQTNDDYAAFAQDDFRLTNNFTLSLGVRWDVYGWIRERHNMLANFDLSQKNADTPYMGVMYYPGTPSHPDRNLFPANKGSFGPRIGFAWSPFGNNKTVIRGGYGMIYSNSLSAAFGQGNGAFSTVGSYVQVSNPVTDGTGMLPGWQLSQGSPAPLIIPDLNANRNNNFQFNNSQTPLFGFIKGDKDPYIQQWNFSIQRELPGNILISAAYVGSHGSHLLGDEIRNTDQVSKADMARVRYHIDDQTYVVDPSLNGYWDDYYGCRQRGLPGNTDVTCTGWYALEPQPQWWSVQAMLSPDGYNKYHSGQFRVEKRYSQGLNFIAAYTYSKNIVSAGLGALVANTIGPTTLSSRGVGRIAYLPGAAAGGCADGCRHTGAEDLQNLRRYDGLSPDDTTHVLNLASTYEFPFGKGKKWMNAGGPANAILGGWKFTQNWNFQTGVPMFMDTLRACDGAYGYLSCRPNAVGDLSAGRSSKNRQQQEEQWYNASALCPAWGCDQTLTTALWNGVYADGTAVDYNAVDAFWQLGNSGLRPPSSRIPGYWNADFSLAKDYRFSESKYLNFRWDVFNALNHQNLGVPDNKWCLPPGPNGEEDYARVFGCTFGKITNVATDPRGMQFSLRYVF